MRPRRLGPHHGTSDVAGPTSWRRRRREVRLERVTGIGPVLQPWEGRALPLRHTRTDSEAPGARSSLAQVWNSPRPTELLQPGVGGILTSRRAVVQVFDRHESPTR